MAALAAPRGDQGQGHALSGAGGLSPELNDHGSLTLLCAPISVSKLKPNRCSHAFRALVPAVSDHLPEDVGACNGSAGNELWFTIVTTTLFLHCGLHPRIESFASRIFGVTKGV
jgi:hypothetical protein